MVKVIDRVLYKLDDLVRPFVHKILLVIEPLLIDEDYYARVEGREIISNLAKVFSSPLPRCHVGNVEMCVEDHYPTWPVCFSDLKPDLKSL